MNTLDLKLDIIIKEIENIKNELKGLLEINQRLIHERLGVPPPPPPSNDNNNNKNIIIIKKHDLNKIIVSGNTYNYKEDIKKSGNCNFDKTTKSWILDHESINDLINNLENLGLEENKDFINEAGSYQEKGFGEI